MATKKIRVYELARELGVENAVVLDLANELKIGVKSHSSSIDEPSADRVRRLADSRGLRKEPVAEPEPEPTPAAPRKTVRAGGRAPAPAGTEPAPVEPAPAEPVAVAPAADVVTEEAPPRPTHRVVRSSPTPPPPP